MEWQKTYGLSGDEYAQAIKQTLDGGYVVAGYTNSLGTGGYDFWVLKLDSQGKVQWGKTYGGSDDEICMSLDLVGEGYVVAGYTDSFGSGGYDFWALGLNSSGGVEWEKAYGGSYDEQAYSVKKVSDGGFVIAGSTNSFGAGYHDFWVVKVDSSGNIVFDSGSGAKGVETSSTIKPGAIDGKDSTATPVEGDGNSVDTKAQVYDTQGEVHTQATPKEVPELSLLLPVVSLLIILLFRMRR